MLSSSTVPSQSVSTPSQVSVAPGWVPAWVSSQSVASSTCWAGASQPVVVASGSPKPSPSASWCQMSSGFTAASRSSQSEASATVFAGWSQAWVAASGSP